MLYLYILKLNKINALKIGIAENQGRIESHLRTYEEFGIDLKESYKINARYREDIKLLEKQMLGDYREYKG